MTGFQYRDPKRQDIIDAIRGRTTADHDVVIAKLADAAGRMVEHRKRERSTPSKKVVDAELKHLTKTLNGLDPRVRELVDHFLGGHRVSLDDVGAAVARAARERASWFPSGKGSMGPSQAMALPEHR